LGDRGVDGFVFRGDDGLDEITLATTTSVLSIGTEEITSGLLDPEEFGIPKAPKPQNPKLTISNLIVRWKRKIKLNLTLIHRRLSRLLGRLYK
jgi:anthranilate phosphoribosyltransferase